MWCGPGIWTRFLFIIWYDYAEKITKYILLKRWNKKNILSTGQCNLRFSPQFEIHSQRYKTLKHFIF